MPGLVIAAMVIAALIVVAVGAFAVYLLTRPVTAVHEGMGPAEHGASDPVHLRMPLEFAPVADESRGRPCPPGFLPENATGGCLLLDPGGFRVARVEQIEAVIAESSGSWAIEIKLTGNDADAFARLTEKVAAAPAGTPGQRIAIVVGEEIVSAPAVMQPITGGEVMISGDFTKADVDALVDRITGG
ncbi:hypothetical protein [Actinomadura sp. WMMB 499]|uniref:SecDF P1 head subdomain-containing protein n=1 Tax=Actinomadura sp. WMMB 499 TaxID=1219491 RepID=UPI001244A5E6|nr:hypothetical protein [Actinomadura sp. WMMB 499]QFG26010.1 hypothetical protein F7P10_37580 [Actinomadura sp. WMMB 499]